MFLKLSLQQISHLEEKRVGVPISSLLNIREVFNCKAILFWSLLTVVLLRFCKPWPDMHSRTPGVELRHV